MGGAQLQIPWVGLGAALFAFFLYANTLGHRYCYDDDALIRDNWVTQGGVGNVGLIFSTDYHHGAPDGTGTLYRPITRLIFALQWWLAADDPRFGHATNVALYSLTGWLLWITWRRILDAYHPVLPALAILLFVAHPVHTEVVANIKSLDEILVLLLCTSALYGIWRYLAAGNRCWLASAVLSYAVALFCKENALVFIGLVPLTLWFFTPLTLRRNLRLSALFLLPALVYLGVRGMVLGAPLGSPPSSEIDNFMVLATTMPERLASAFMISTLHLRVLILAHPLISDLGYPALEPVRWSDWRAMAGLAIHVGLLLWALWNVRRKHLLAYAALFYLVSLAPTSNVPMLIGAGYAERLQYTPVFGYALALAWLLTRLGRVTPATPPNSSARPGNVSLRGTLMWGVASVLLIVGGTQTVTRNQAWYSSETLYRTDLRQAPRVARLNYHLGLETMKRGMADETGQDSDGDLVWQAIAHLTRALQLHPNYGKAYAARARAYMSRGDHPRAYADFDTALALRPYDARILTDRGFLHVREQRLADAETDYSRAIAADPDYHVARRNRGVVLAMQRRFAAAITSWKEALRIAPEDRMSMRFIGHAYRDLGQFDEAQTWFARAAAAPARRPVAQQAVNR